MHVCKVYICVHTTPRLRPHFVGHGDIVISIDTIFQDNTQQYVIYVVLQVSKGQILEALQPRGKR